jgi:hypothetical protein
MVQALGCVATLMSIPLLPQYAVFGDGAVVPMLLKAIVTLIDTC